MFDNIKKYKWSDLSGLTLKIKTIYDFESGMAITYGFDNKNKKTYILGEELESDIKRISLLMGALYTQELINNTD